MSQEKVRLSIEVSIPIRERMEELRDRLGTGSLTEVIRRAVDVYDTVLKAQARGDRLVLRDEHGEEQELLLVREIV